MCSSRILKMVGNKDRQFTSTEPWNDSTMYEDQYSVPLPPIQLLEIKQLHILTLFETVYL